ncbi:MAG: AcvB/VirJ family lysyl-phosphatidylglycerol hydrolase [Anaeromyxobacter sp.]
MTPAALLAAALALGAPSRAGPLEVPPGGAAGARGYAMLLAGARDAGPAAKLGRELSEAGVVVRHLDVQAHFAAAGAPRRCVYLAGDLEELAQGDQKRLGFARYLRPVLVGVGPGVPAAAGSVAQAPDGTFRGAILVGPAPEAPAPGQPRPARLCEGKEPVKTAVLRVPDTAGARAALETLLASGPAGPAPAGPAPAETAQAGPVRPEPVEGRTKDARAETDVSDLPLHEVRSAVSGTRLAVLLTGDGGWAGLDKGLSASLAAAGVPVVGLDSLAYFWKRRTPEETAEALARIIRHYLAAWGREEVLLLGYSRGADLVPFLPPRLPEDVRPRVVLVGMLGPATFAEFEVHSLDVLFSIKRGDAMSTARAVEALGALPVVCIQGSDEGDSGCPGIAARPNVRRWLLPGGHHFDRDYDRLARLVLSAAPTAAER